MTKDRTRTAWPNPTAVTTVLQQLLSSAQPAATAAPLTYLRRKPGRGMVAVFGAAGHDGQIFTATVDEAATVAGTGGVDAVAALPTQRQGELPDLVEVPSLGLTVQRFPYDRGLAELAAAMSPAEQPALGAALLAAARRAMVAGTWELASVTAEPVRYKPGDRCVIRYRLRLRRTDDGTGEVAACTVIGKLYRDVGEARAADDLMRRLRDAGASRWTAAPLGVVEPMPLALSEDLGSSHDDPPTLPGLHVLGVAHEQPTRALRLAAQALAELHTGGVDLPGMSRRTGADESVKAAKRAKVLERHVPVLTERIRDVAGTLCDRLDALPEDVMRPAHGSYKASQLLFRDDSVFLVDFDQFCLADPALDVGYFLAYLRPPGLWYHRAGTRSWFEAAASTFLSAYVAHLTERGESPAVAAQVAARSHVYEAALLFKIAARRANRLHSPRPGEVGAVMSEVAAVLEEDAATRSPSS
jgi:hypothetical protein